MQELNKHKTSPDALQAIALQDITDLFQIGPRKSASVLRYRLVVIQGAKSGKIDLCPPWVPRFGLRDRVEGEIVVFVTDPRTPIPAGFTVCLLNEK